MVQIWMVANTRFLKPRKGERPPGRRIALFGGASVDTEWADAQIASHHTLRECVENWLRESGHPLEERERFDTLDMWTIQEGTVVGDKNWASLNHVHQEIIGIRQDHQAWAHYQEACDE
jgi:hypothetical protein